MASRETQALLKKPYLPYGDFQVTKEWKYTSVPGSGKFIFFNPANPSEHFLLNQKETGAVDQLHEYLSQKGNPLVEYSTISNPQFGDKTLSEIGEEKRKQGLIEKISSGQTTAAEATKAVNDLTQKVQTQPQKIEPLFDPKSDNTSSMKGKDTSSTDLGGGSGSGGVGGSSNGVAGAGQVADAAALGQPPAGVDAALWASLSPADKAFVSAMNTQAQNTYQQGLANYSINAQTMQKALELAQNDPTIKAIYGDQAEIALSDLHNNLGVLNAEYASQFGLQTAEQAKAKKDLAEKYAGMGQAISGFRNQAEQLQKQQQTAVIQSSKRLLEQNVRQLGAQYESQFGSGALPAGGIQAGGAVYDPYGGITGSQPIAEKQAIEQKQLQNYQTISNPLTK